ncbi:MAG TPA: glutamine-hydrolyzing GMP synthase subunit GuaA, partial [Thermoplasmata archaeon]|nr:glutamine-hydrolyzing GMP synthase subunit GuaA [Thermoplasmata archaeon]
MKDPTKFVDEALRSLRASIPGKTIVAASGGIDSTAAAVLTHRAVGDRARSLFVDTGLLRKNEVELVRGFFAASELPVTVVPAADRFLSSLEAVSDPEEKRRRIGTAFIRLFEEEADKFGADRLVQGTIAPDWIESGGALRDVIKTHHNVGGV